MVIQLNISVIHELLWEKYSVDVWYEACAVNASVFG